MAAPTAQVTRYAQEFLEIQHEVVLALRVEWGPEVIGAHKRRSFWTAGVGPALAALGGLRETIKRTGSDSNAGVGILALTATDGRVLLSARPLQRKWPTGIVETYPEATALLPDVDLLETHLIAALTVGDRQFVVNNIDFKKLLDAVEDRTVRSPEIKAVLPQLRSVTVGYPLAEPEGDTEP